MRRRACDSAGGSPAECREDFIEAATTLEIAYALSAGDEPVTARRDEIALMAAIRANLVKYTAGAGRGRESIERDIRRGLRKFGAARFFQIFGR